MNSISFIRGQIPQDWAFVGGPWTISDEGVICPPHNLVDENLAFLTTHAYADFQAEFEFRWDITASDSGFDVHTNAGFLFGAADARHYYMVHFPAEDQQSSTEYFWAVISIVDVTGYARILKMERVAAVSTTLGLWHKAKVRVVADEVSVTLDDRPGPVVCDDTYRSAGRIGLASASGLGATPKSSFRNLRIQGEPVSAAAWNESIKPPRRWSVADPEHGIRCGNIVRAAAGELLAFSAGRLLCSVDNGRTWSIGESLPTDFKVLDGWGEQCPLRARPDGQLEIYSLSHTPPFLIQKATSNDQGKSWSSMRKVGQIRFSPQRAFDRLCSSGLLSLADGSLLLFAFAYALEQVTVVDGRMFYIYPPPGTIDVCLRSTDGGESWSGPANLDGPPYDDSRWMFAKDTDVETSKVQLPDGTILRMSRPFYSPFMWESRSHDGGRSWSPAARSAFPMYACTEAMVCTSSGTLLIGGRFPSLTVQVSHDRGLSWQAFVIDQTGARANGAMFEVEPDVVVFIYGGWTEPDQLRYQLLRVTGSGIEPA